MSFAIEELHRAIEARAARGSRRPGEVEDREPRVLTEPDAPTTIRDNAEFSDQTGYALIPWLSWNTTTWGG